MKKFLADVGQPKANPSVDMPPADSPSESDPPTDQENSIQLSPSLPPEIQEQIICRVPAEQRLVFAGIDPSWRNAFMGLPSCWRGIRLGRNANCYPTTPPAIHRADYYPLTRVEEVEFTSAIPAVIRLWRGDPASNWALRPEEIPYSWLGLVLKHASNLRRLDLSRMSVGKDNVALFGALWSDVVENSQLTNLKLPKGFLPTETWLKEVAAKHTRLNYLSLSILSHGIAWDPFKGFTSLKSLSLEVLPCRNRDDRHQAIEAVLNRLQIESLELSGDLGHLFVAGDLFPPLSEYVIPSQVTTPKLLDVLVHLRINYFAHVEYAEYFLYHCRLLKTLRLDNIVLPSVWTTPYYQANPPLIQSRHLISPFLQSVFLRFVNSADEFGKYFRRQSHGLERLTNILRFCPTFTDLAISVREDFKGLNVGDIFPLPECTPSIWSKVSSISFCLAPEELPAVKNTLAHMVKLQSLTLQLQSLEFIGRRVASAENGSGDNWVIRPLDSLVLNLEYCIVTDDNDDLGWLEEILSSWSQIRHLSLDVSVPNTIYFGEVSSGWFGAQFPLINPVPAIQGLEEFHLSFNRLGEPEDNDIVLRAMIPGAAWASLATMRNLKVLILECPLRLEPDTFPTIVSSTPQLERFESAVKERMYQSLCGLQLNDLLAVRGWKRLRTCRLTIDVDRQEIVSDPPSPRTFLKLKDMDFVPQLVKQWKEELRMLELMDVLCRVVVDDKYLRRNLVNWELETQESFSIPIVSRFVDWGTLRVYSFYPLVFGSKCDCGHIHFWIDAKSATAKCLGFLEPPV